MVREYIENSIVTYRFENGSEKSSTTKLPYAREMTTFLNRPPSQKQITEIDPFCCPLHVFTLFLDELAQEKYV